MKKNGFTLVELLAVVSIISILLLLVAPKIVNQLNNSKKDVNDVTKKLIYNAAEKYIKDNNMNLEYDYCLSVEELQDKEYLSDTITDNKSGLDISKKSVVITPKENLEYEYELTNECTSATDEDYRGYYADVDGDGNADGVIYADLGANIEYPQSGQWGNSNGTYTYNKAIGELNEYTISKEKYTGEKAKFGEKEIIKLKKDKDNPRFYVMALTDFTTEAYTDPNDSNNNYPAYTTYYWYKNANNKMPSTVKDTSPNFGTGYDNTGTMIRIWDNNGDEKDWVPGATQYKRDIWKHIKEKYNNEKWYIPSKEEWAAFGDYFTSKEENRLTHNYESGSYVANSGNYSSLYGLSGWYWSSSQDNTYRAWSASFDYGYMFSGDVSNEYSVRLGATF